MTTTQTDTSIRIFHLRQVDADQAPVSLGLFTTIDKAWAHARGECLTDEFLTMAEAQPEVDVLDNWFVVCFEGSLDECGTNADQVDAGDVRDLASLLDESAEVISTVWVEEVVVH